MRKYRLYALALQSIRPEPSPLGGDEDGYMINLHAGIIFDYSIESAEEKGILIAKERWPERDGYVGHSCKAVEIDLKDLRRVIDMVEVGELNEGFNTNDDWPDMIQ
jgi:hypothetical protein